MKTTQRLIFCLVASTLLFFGCDKSNNTTQQPTDEEPLMESVRLYAPGDYGSANWRIPALLCLDDGSLLALCDKRKYNEGDLPEDIDIVSCRSTDRGKSWSEPLTIAAGTGVKHGFGDAALVQCESGVVVCAYVGGNGLWASTEDEPQRSYVRISTDGGRSWGEPSDITAQLWGSQASAPERRSYHSSFFASGNGLRLRKGTNAGRIMFAAAMARTGANVLDNYIVYSDDEGKTWQVSSCAFTEGDEAKLVELNDGTVLLSVRRSGARGYNTSTDGGVTWDGRHVWNHIRVNACNGDIIRVDDSLLLHSLPNSMQRENVSLFPSTDEGKSWQKPILLVEGASAYSSMTVLDDGSIGIFVEQGSPDGYELWFHRINRAWLAERRKNVAGN